MTNQITAPQNNRGLNVLLVYTNNGFNMFIRNFRTIYNDNNQVRNEAHLQMDLIFLKINLVWGKVQPYIAFKFKLCNGYINAKFLIAFLGR